MRPEDILGSDPPLDDGPPPWTWEEYMAWLEPAWGRLLDERPDECDMQRFLEEHPCLLPGAFPMWGSSAGGHGAFPKACVTQPPLQGLGKRIPDFLWIARDSAFLRPVFIEIEDPKKRWFGKRRQQSADLTQALEQIREWREWFNSPANQQVFLDAYAIPLEWRSRKFKPTFVLVYGLASEGRVEIGRLRAHHGADDFVLTHV